MRKTMFAKTLFAVAVVFASASVAHAAGGEARAPKHGHWRFSGVFGTYDKDALQRGFQVYREVCASCHSLNFIAFRHLGDEGGPTGERNEAVGEERLEPFEGDRRERLDRPARQPLAQRLERGLARPSITALQEIAGALGVPIGWFFQSDGPVPADERPYIVRANRRRRLSYAGMASTDYMGCEDHLLSANLDGELALGISRYAPGGTAGDDLYTHQGEEAGLVLEGEIELTLDREVFRLKPGDSFSFPAGIPHTYRNPGKTPAVIVWANTPVTLRR